MAYLSSSTIARIQSQITAKEAALTAANEAYTRLLASGDVESYTFDSREGKQSTTMRSPSVLGKEISRLEAELERLYRRLNGGGIVNFNLRRRNGC